MNNIKDTIHEFDIESQRDDSYVFSGTVWSVTITIIVLIALSYVGMDVDLTNILYKKASDNTKISITFLSDTNLDDSKASLKSGYSISMSEEELIGNSEAIILGDVLDISNIEIRGLTYHGVNGGGWKEDYGKVLYRSVVTIFVRDIYKDEEGLGLDGKAIKVYILHAIDGRHSVFSTDTIARRLKVGQSGVFFLRGIVPDDSIRLGSNELKISSLASYHLTDSISGIILKDDDDITYDDSTFTTLMEASNTQDLRLEDVWDIIS